MHRMAGQIITNVKRFTQNDFTGEPHTLGTGTEGVVYRWRSNDSGDVAVKVLNKELPLSEMTEAQRLIGLSSHPNIIPIYGLYQQITLFSQTGFKGYVMEYSEQGSLDTVVFDLSRNYPDSQVYEWMQQAAMGIQHLHQNGILHRDIKLQNMILAKDGNIKITDFGLSKDLSSTATASFVMCGSPGFMAPEIVRFAYSDRSDVYAFAMTVWQMFHREKISNHPDLREGIQEYFAFVDDIRHRPVCSLSVDEKVRNLLRRAWANLPGNRPPIGAFIALADQLLQSGLRPPMPVPSAPLEETDGEAVVQRQQETPNRQLGERRPLKQAKFESEDKDRQKQLVLVRRHLDKIAYTSDPALKEKSYTFDLIAIDQGPESIGKTIKHNVIARFRRYFELLNAEEWIVVQNLLSSLAKSIRNNELEGRNIHVYTPVNFSRKEEQVINNFVRAQPTHKGLHLYEICLAGGDVLVLTYCPSDSTPIEMEQYAETIDSCVPCSSPSITKKETVLEYVPVEKRLLEAPLRRTLCIDTTEDCRFQKILSEMTGFYEMLRRSWNSFCPVGSLQQIRGDGMNLELIVPKFQKRRLKKSMWSEVRDILEHLKQIDDILVFIDSSHEHDKTTRKDVAFIGKAKLICIYSIEWGEYVNQRKGETLAAFDASFQIWRREEANEVKKLFRTLNERLYTNKWYGVHSTSKKLL